MTKLHERAAAILDYWFGDLDNNSSSYGEYFTLWYVKNPDTDSFIVQEFGGDLQKAVAGEYDDWLTHSEGRIAFIVLLDQFSRNIYRDKPESFSQDALALKIAIEGIELGHDKALTLPKRAFFYMPFEHSEDSSMQEESMRLFTELLNDAPNELKEFAKGALVYAEKHKAIIDQFGHYPHRNNIIGRVSTAKEVEFLQQPGSSF